MKVLDFPLTKIVISFVLGILICYHLQPSFFIAGLAFLINAVLFLCLYFLSKNNKIALTCFGISTLLLSFTIGMITLLFHTSSNQKTNYTHCQKAFEKPQIITITLREKLNSNDYNERYIAIFNKIENNDYSGKIILNIQKDSSKNPLLIGNIIRVKTILQHITPSKNPSQFDYSQYLANKQIYAQIFVKKHEISINQKLEKDIWFYTARLHSRIVRNLEKAKFNKPEMNVALALILGQKQEISSDIVKDYQYAGVTHILSVSGLHVGYIMIFILFILKPIPNTRKGSLLKLLAILFSLSFFAVISGLSPSVLRSVVMFSFVATANHLRRSNNIYHTLLVSMLLILVFEPYFLFDVGFQLSYLALFSIVWLQPLLKKIWYPKNRILKYIWEALTVSFAAQIGTFPLCLYYFHQFPTLFFVTNIIILPIISFSMIVGIVVMILTVFNICPLLLVNIFEKSIYLLNHIIHFIASFESFVIRDISFNFYYLLSFYLLLISSVIWLKKPNNQKLIIVLITVICVQLSFIYTEKQIKNQRELIVYNSKKNTFISERRGKNITLFTNDSLTLKKSKKSILDSYINENFGSLKKTCQIKNLLFFNGKKILLIDSSGVYTNKMQPDVLILTQSSKVNLDRILEQLSPKIIIADASNSYSIQKIWAATCLKRNIPFHSTNEKGFYKLN